MEHCLTKANENIIPWLSQIETKQKPISEHDIALFSPLTDVSQGLSNRGCENCVCPSVYVCMSNIYLLLQFCTDYNQTWINMIWAVAAKTLLCQIFHKWHRIKVNCVYISRCNWYCTSGMPATQHVIDTALWQPQNVAWCLLRQRTASKGVSKHYSTQQTKRSNLPSTI